MYLVDTNILVYHFNQSLPDSARPKMREILVNHFHISIITRMEFLGFRGHTLESYQKAHRFLSYATECGLDDEIADIVITLRREKSIKLPDAIIAATALQNNWTLVTRNDKDFTQFDIDIYNPFVP